jgi:predicted amidophosphoribosyltransferase
VLDAWLDLVLGSRCVCCTEPGRALCRACAAALPTTAAAAWPTPTPAGLVRPASVGEYAEPLRELIGEHKENGRLALARPLGGLLAVAVLDVLTAAAPGARPPLDLVPMPSHPAVVRERGHDPLLRITRAAAARLRREGVECRVSRSLRVIGRPGDQAGLSASGRAGNVRGRFAVRSRPDPRRRVVLVDDVITTGSTLREAQRALEECGTTPLGAATIAATRRRLWRMPDPDPGYRIPIAGH